jgi:hypothetical protein
LRPPPLPHQIGLLQQVLEQISSISSDGSSPPVVVFDLDATLYDNRTRTLTILMEYADEVQDQAPDVAESLRSLVSDRVQYLLSDTLRGCGLTQSDVVKDITHYWHERFFSDEYCSHDVPLDGAPEFVRACHESGATLVYLTGRDIPGMLLGTVSSLREHGFPIGVAGVELVLKPDATMSDEAFKRGALPTLSRVGEVVAFFDNEPANCNLARNIYPECTVFLLETQSVPGAPDPDDGIQKITDFRIL